MIKNGLCEIIFAKCVAVFGGRDTGEHKGIIANRVYVQLNQGAVTAVPTQTVERSTICAR